MKEEILSFLRKQKNFTSGEAISRELGITRSAVWKTIQSLRSQGYRIESIKHHGYRMIEDPDLFNELEIKDMLSLVPELGNIRLFYFDKIDSTNQAARRASEQQAPEWSLFVADCQTAGRGRLGRSWHSQAGSGLWFSVLLRPKAEPASLSNLTLFAGLCAAKALRSATGLDIAIKWPNDLVAMPSGRKVCGILTEMILEEFNVQAAILGIGINVNNLDFPPDIKDMATSLSQAGGISLSRIALLKSVLTELKAGYTGFVNSLDAEEPAWLQEYAELCATLQRSVVIRQTDGQSMEGIAVGITSNGDLIVKLADGKIIHCHSGEVSVRGLLGYI